MADRMPRTRRERTMVEEEDRGQCNSGRQRKEREEDMEERKQRIVSDDNIDPKKKRPGKNPDHGIV